MEPLVYQHTNYLEDFFLAVLELVLAAVLTGVFLTKVEALQEEVLVEEIFLAAEFKAAIEESWLIAAFQSLKLVLAGQPLFFQM